MMIQINRVVRWRWDAAGSRLLMFGCCEIKIKITKPYIIKNLYNILYTYLSKQDNNQTHNNETIITEINQQWNNQNQSKEKIKRRKRECTSKNNGNWSEEGSYDGEVSWQREYVVAEVNMEKRRRSEAKKGRRRWIEDEDGRLKKTEKSCEENWERSREIERKTEKLCFVILGFKNFNYKF